MNKRAEEILSAIIKEYIETALPVGSFSLVNGHRFPFSSATIRAEMAILEDLGFLMSPHTSAGRIPTEKGYRYYIENFSDEFELSFRELQAIKRKILSFSSNFDRMMDMAAKTIAEITGNAGLTSDNGIVYHYGITNLLRQPEFKKEEYVIGVADIFDNLSEIVKEAPENKEIEVYIGHENPIGKNANCSMVITRFWTPYQTKGVVGIIGPTRMSYEKNVKVVDLVKSVLEEQLIN